GVRASILLRRSRRVPVPIYPPVSPHRAVHPLGTAPVGLPRGRMKDLTQDSIVKNILTMAAPMAIGMLFQTLYLLVDLYFVASLGDAAIAGVGAAGTLMFVVLALTQVLGVGAVALISQAVGRKDREDANLVFNQSLMLAAVCAVLTLRSEERRV